ncbi:uncharacterized protein L969DRAFT_81643 [Mixia osmundae IAM 14324]|uniref:Uncharacterized protein n=1 Tax=Mixia osmundae (strain CBS 9802 / IAM 14324 / JCM 22182 / KY 12970) TaxID=764103 RepID=G7E5J4_MIXOS|nr:uncharacterized protein L969DRAFT_81643 [Mixia osmundae IAM 14324]KEI40748.1 hypothetical protein L969DRAFT_81643 [Mixia osmundae IAM 14324]GAA98104.1 hypothetical protein E5Q_04787 [Mixia osmundae IAM 14324]
MTTAKHSRRTTLAISLLLTSYANAQAAMPEASKTASPTLLSAAIQGGSLGISSVTVATGIAASAAASATSVIMSNAQAATSTAATVVTTSVAAVSGGAGGLIPDNMSESCTNFLVAFNEDPVFASCSAPLLSAISAFAPASTTTVSNTLADSSVTAFCATSSSSGCSDSAVRSALNQFSTNCTTELNSPSGDNLLVKTLYDAVYLLNPFRTALCTLDSATGKSCAFSQTSASAATANLTQSSAAVLLVQDQASFDVSTLYYRVPQDAISAGSWSTVSSNKTTHTKSHDKRSHAHHHELAKRQEAAATDTASAATTTATGSLLPNGTTFRTLALPFLQLSLSTSTGNASCTECAQSVLASYIAWEKSQPYVIGLGNSDMLGGQSALWRQVSTSCGTHFTTTINKNAGITSFLTGSAPMAPHVHGALAFLILSLLPIIFTLA